LSIKISHITFVVKDLELSATFFERIFKAKVVYSSLSAKYMTVNNVWIALNKGDSLSERSYNHIAFQIQDSEFSNYLNIINEMGLDIKSGRPRSIGEGQSIYFYDYDNHLFELHTGTLNERIDSYQLPDDVVVPADLTAIEESQNDYERSEAVSHSDINKV